MDEHLHVAPELHHRLKTFGRRTGQKLKPLVERWLTERLEQEGKAPVPKKSVRERARRLGVRPASDATMEERLFAAKPFWKQPENVQRWERERAACQRLAVLRTELADLPPDASRWAALVAELQALERDLGLTVTTRVGRLAARDSDEE